MPSALKRFRSWFRSETLESYESPLSGTLEVSLLCGKPVLNSDTSNYSFGSLHKVMQRVLKDEALKVIELEPALILGLGAGSLMHIFRKEWQWDVPVTGVEIDPIVLQAGRKYFELDKYENLDIVQSDALDYVRQCDREYGLIIVDVYVGSEVPAALQEEAFIRQLARITSRPGMVLFNRMVSDKEGAHATARLLSWMEQHFDVARMRRIKGRWSNHIIIGEFVKNDKTVFGQFPDGKR
jgi:uncharacterized protein YuzB (UPF0349 family)